MALWYAAEVYRPIYWEDEGDCLSILKRFKPDVHWWKIQLSFSNQTDLGIGKELSSGNEQ